MRSGICCYRGQHGALPWPCCRGVGSLYGCFSTFPWGSLKNSWHNFDWPTNLRVFLIDGYRVMSLVNICDFRTCNEVWTSYVACKKLTPWVWLQALYELPTACKQFVFQLRTFLEEFCLYHVNICMYIYPCIDTHLRVSVCLALYLITSGGKTLQDSSVAASL